MKFIKTLIPEVLIIEPEKHDDDRGFFLEYYHQQKFHDNGIKHSFVQSNHSKSIKNTLRGLHFQSKNPQGKLVRCIHGKIFDVAVDIRKNSPTYGNWVGKKISSENFLQLYIPIGFAHGFLVLSDVAEVIYQTSELYSPNYDSGIIWNDENLNIDWGISNPILSDKDKNLPTLDKFKAGE